MLFYHLGGVKSGSKPVRHAFQACLTGGCRAIWTPLGGSLSGPLPGQPDPINRHENGSKPVRNVSKVTFRPEGRNVTF